MPEYDINPYRYGSHYLIGQEIGCGKTVLDVGCNKGYIKEVAPSNDFYGIERDGASIKEALAAGYKEVFNFDLNRYESFTCSLRFDVIIFADILEHLSFPERALRFFCDNCLEKNGSVIISLPNIAHFCARLNLLLGKFEYTASGTLDKTHLHFYTLATARSLIQACGLKVVKQKFSSNNFGAVIRMLPVLGPILGYNLIFVCKKEF